MMEQPTSPPASPKPPPAETNETTEAKGEDNFANGLSGFLQLVQDGTSSSKEGLDNADMHEMRTAPLFSGEVKQLLGSGSYSSSGTHQFFPQFGLLGLRQETYNSGLGPAFVPPTGGQDLIFANMDAPWSAFICGSQGAGKSHSLSCLLENSLLQSSRAGYNPNPLAGLIFHYDKFTGHSSTQLCEAAYLCSAGVPVRILVSPSNLETMHKLYHNLPGLPEGAIRPQVMPLYFQEKHLTVSNMMTLMAVNDSKAVPLYVEVIHKVLRDMSMENQGGSGVDYLDFRNRLRTQGFSADQNGPLTLRLQLLEAFLASREQAAETTEMLTNLFQSAQGTLTIVDLSCPFVNEKDACALFAITLSIFMQHRADCGRVVALDEAHKFLTKTGEAQALTEELISIVRQQRHLATRVIVSTQEPTLAPQLLDLCNVSIIHRFNSPAWFKVLKDHLAGARLFDEGPNDELFGTIVGLHTGEALVFCPSAALDARDGRVLRLQQSFIRMKVRSRVTADGGKSIMASEKVVSAKHEKMAMRVQPFSLPESSQTANPRKPRFQAPSATSTSIRHGTISRDQVETALRKVVIESMVKDPQRIDIDALRKSAAEEMGVGKEFFISTEWKNSSRTMIRRQALLYAQAHGLPIPKYGL